FDIDLSIMLCAQIFFTSSLHFRMDGIYCYAATFSQNESEMDVGLHYLAAGLSVVGYTPNTSSFKQQEFRCTTVGICMCLKQAPREAQSSSSFHCEWMHYVPWTDEIPQPFQLPLTYKILNPEWVTPIEISLPQLYFGVLNHIFSGLSPAQGDEPNPDGMEEAKETLIKLLYKSLINQPRIV
ncbi:hypothetical protein KI387_000544, partial [Taxus chinensis]